MKKVLLMITSPTKGGNGDALINAAAKVAKQVQAEVTTVHMRDLQVHFCQACYGCARTGVCVQNDDFHALLKQAHKADVIIAEAPIYYNCMAAQMMTLINRLCCTFACKTYELGVPKRVGMMLTCTGSEEAEMKYQVDLILTLPSLSRSITAYQTEVFTGCQEAITCQKTTAYLERAERLTRWTLEEE